MCELKIIFPNEQAKQVFATWMSDGGGEQDFFESLYVKGIGADWRISYHPENGQFLEDNTIRVIQNEKD